MVFVQYSNYDLFLLISLDDIATYSAVVNENVIILRNASRFIGFTSWRCL